MSGRRRRMSTLLSSSPDRECAPSPPHRDVRGARRALTAPRRHLRMSCSSRSALSASRSSRSGHPYYAARASMRSNAARMISGFRRSSLRRAASARRALRVCFAVLLVGNSGGYFSASGSAPRSRTTRSLSPRHDPDLLFRACGPTLAPRNNSRSPLPMIRARTWERCQQLVEVLIPWGAHGLVWFVRYSVVDVLAALNALGKGGRSGLPVGRRHQPSRQR